MFYNAKPPKPFTYRADIDGLRAISVISVVLYHAGISFMPGGFVGVDVFFVISGFLITSTILSELENSNFSFLNFYERRARRILPALFFMLFCLLPFSWHWLVPVELVNLGRSLQANALFASNILFWLDTNYFEPVIAAYRPLLHTWTLAVEEQYYILFPLFLFIIWRFKFIKIHIVLLMAILISLVLAEWGWRNTPVANFYLLPTRGWELMLGSLASVLCYKKKIISNSWLALSGLLLIFYSVLTFDKYTPFPSLYTIIPVLGASLILVFNSHNTLAFNILNWRPFVFIGLISYSLYLWHQPIFAFSKIRFGHELSIEFTILLFVITFVVAVFSWYFIERPFRSKSSGAVSRSAIWIFAFTGLIGFFVIGALIQYKNGFPSRINFWDKLNSIPTVSSTFCHNLGRRSVEQLNSGDLCIIGLGEPSVAIIGDSHAGALFDAFNSILLSRDIGAVAISGSFCAPLLNGFEAHKDCRELMNAGFNQIISNPKITDVMLVAEWSYYTNGYRDEGLINYFRDNDGKARTAAENAIVFDRAFASTIKSLQLANKKISVLLPIPEFKDPTNKSILRASLVDPNLSFKDAVNKLTPLTLKSYKLRNSSVFNTFAPFQGTINLIDTKDLFCNLEICLPFDKSGKPLFSDTNHVNKFGAQLIVNSLNNNWSVLN